MTRSFPTICVPESAAPWMGCELWVRFRLISPLSVSVTKELDPNQIYRDGDAQEEEVCGVRPLGRGLEVCGRSGANPKSIHSCR